MLGRTVSRRKFLRSTASAATALSAAGPLLGALGANERIRTGHIGIGGQGTMHLRRCASYKDCQIVAVCDVDESHRAEAAKIAGTNPKQFSDFRQVLDMKDLDVVFIVTPDHWHAIPTIQAVQAGKDIYVEKPLGHNVHEGRVILDLVRKSDRIVQIGTQQRSHPHWINAVKRIKDGELGQVTTVNAWNAWNRKEMGGDMGKPADSEPPPGVDYDMWLGPAAKRPFNRARFHFYFYFWWDYAGGMVSDWAVHLFDIVMWALGYNIKSVAASGGIYALKDLRETPDTAAAVFDCGNYVMTYSLRHANGWRPHGDMDHGLEFIGTEGILQINRNGFQMYHEADRASRKPYYTEDRVGDFIELHHRNFFACVRSRKQPAADAEVGHINAIPGHLANIAYRVGRTIRWDAEKETIPGDPQAAALLTREYRTPWHL